MSRCHVAEKRPNYVFQRAHVRKKGGRGAERGEDDLSRDCRDAGEGVRPGSTGSAKSGPRRRGHSGTRLHRNVSQA